MTDQTERRDRYAEVLWPLTDWDGDRINAERAADAVLAVRDDELADLRAAIERVQLACHDLPHDSVRRVLAALDGTEPPAAAPAVDRAVLERVRVVLETEPVVGRSALEYRGLIASALMTADPDEDPS